MSCLVHSSNPGLLSYHANHRWAKLPDSVELGYTHGVAEDHQGRMIIANRSRHAVAFFSPDGDFLHSWGEAYASGAHGLTVNQEAGEEFVYLANTNQAEVVKATLDGEVVWKIGTPDLPSVYSADRPFSPTETAVASDGSVYVADGYGQSRIHIYDQGGRYLSTFGQLGSGPGELDCPHGITIDTRTGTESLLVANRKNRRIDRFSLEGEFEGTVVGPEQLRFPCTAVIAGDRMYVPDLFARVSVFGHDNRLLGHLGDYIEGRRWDKQWGSFHELDVGLAGYPNIEQSHRRDGHFSSPHGLAVDRAGNLYVVEWIINGRLSKLRPLN